MDAVERFLKYVAFDTQSQEDSSTFPSTLKQKKLGEYLLAELKGLGVKEAHMDEYGYVYAYIAGSHASSKTIGLISHMDTSPDAPGHDIHPRIVTVNNEDIAIGNHLKLSKEELKNKIGHRLIVTDGTTLLGADDKSGIAIIMSVVEHVLNHADQNYPNIVVCFTPDEEVGRGTDHFDYEWYKRMAPDAYTYTVDGGAIEEINYETFNAASAKVLIHGKSIHPGSAKNRMINAQIVAMELFNMLPPLERPEHTDNYEGFFHLTNMTGDVSEASLSFIIRDHDRQLFENRKIILQKAVEEINRRYGDVAECTIVDSYYNMRSEIMKKPALVSLVKNAMAQFNITPIEKPIRGGTDGARLSFEGIPCPNLGTGGENFHGPLEYLDIDDFRMMIKIIIEMLNAVVHEE